MTDTPRDETRTSQDETETPRDAATTPQDETDTHPHDGLPDETHVGRIALRVADVDAVAAFYRDVVGLEAIDRSEGVIDESGETTTLGVDGTPLLVLRRDEDAPPRPADAAGLYHTAFRFPTRAALGDALARVREHTTLTGASDHLVSEALYLDDPEGNGVELYWDRPREEWPRTSGGHPRIDTLPLDLGDLSGAADGGSVAPHGTDVGHVHLEVSALPAAREFYVETLGFGVVMDAGSALFVAAGDYHHHVGLNTWQGRSAPASGRGLAWFELVVPGDADLAAVRDRLEASNRRSAEADRWQFSETGDGFAVEDPDGITVRIRAAG